jgi:stress response protein YsnF
MTDIDQRPVADLTGKTVVDPDGDKIGTVVDVYVDNDTDRPEWLAVTTGLFGTKVSFVPIVDAWAVGDDLAVPYTKSTVKDAPNAEADGQLSSDEEAALYRHYGRGGTDTTTRRDRRDVGTTTGRDTSGPATDDAMTRSEEELDVSKRTREAGRARLRKWIETEDVQMTVPIRREKARVVVEPITDANRDAALSGGDLTTEEHEVTLSEEVVDVHKHVEPKERVRLETEVETDQVVVDEQVRKERIDTDVDQRR